MKEKDCIFCKIAAGEIPSATLYEDDDFRVILDLGPASKGHALILPKEHYRNLYDLDDELAAKGEQCNLAEIEKDISERDYRDMHREIAPLKAAEDAVMLDSSDLNIDEVVEAIYEHAKKAGLDA